MKGLGIICLLVGFLFGGAATIWVDKAFPADISFEWSPEGYENCMTCTFDLWKNENIIFPDIPKTQTTIAVPLLQEKAEDDYKLTAKDGVRRSGFSRVVRVGDENFPVITKITETKQGEVR